MRLHRIIGCVLIAPLRSAPACAHVVFNKYELMTGNEAGWHFLWQGFQHILPLGFDHILFVLSLYLLSPRLKTILWQASAFTLAHSLTLGLAMYGLIRPPSAVVEPLIAISIAVVAIENIMRQDLRASRLGIVFLFGLVHGLGFAGALSDLGLPKKHFLTTLITFNVGVEFGQIAVILMAYLLFGRWFSDKPYYHRRIVVPISLLVALTAGYWTVERIFFS